VSDLKGLSFLAVAGLALLLAPGCPTAATGADGGTETGTSGSGTSGGATTGGASTSTGGGSTGGGTTGASTSGGTSGGTGTSSTGGSTTGGSTTGGSGGSSSGGTTGGTDGGMSDGGADAGTGDAGCVLADCEDAGYTCCAGFDHCVDVSNDSANCGTCGKLCNFDQMCSAGLCGAPPCNGSLCGAAGGCCLDSCCHAGEICCEVHNGAVFVQCYNATDGCPLSCKMCP
jgi:hypothetical protein